MALMGHFPELETLPIKELAPAVEPLYQAHLAASKSPSEINELQGDRL